MSELQSVVEIKTPEQIGRMRETCLLFSGSDDTSVRVWTLESKKYIVVLEKHFSHVTSLALSEDGNSLLSDGRDKAPDDSNLPVGSSFIKDFKGRTIALGSYNTVDPSMEHVYSVIVEEIFDRDTKLFEEDGKLGDIMIGGVINWPKACVKPYRQ